MIIINTKYGQTFVNEENVISVEHCKYDGCVEVTVPAPQTERGSWGTTYENVTSVCMEPGTPTIISEGNEVAALNIRIKKMEAINDMLRQERHHTLTMIDEVRSVISKLDADSPLRTQLQNALTLREKRNEEEENRCTEQLELIKKKESETCEDKVLDRHLFNAVPDLDRRACGAIQKEGIWTVRQMLSHTRHEIRRIRGVGKKAMQAIDDFMAENDLKWESVE